MLCKIEPDDHDNLSMGKEKNKTIICCFTLNDADGIGKLCDEIGLDPQADVIASFTS